MAPWLVPCVVPGVVPWLVPWVVPWLVCVLWFNSEQSGGVQGWSSSQLQFKEHPSPKLRRAVARRCRETMGQELIEATSVNSTAKIGLLKVVVIDFEQANVAQIL